MKIENRGSWSESIARAVIIACALASLSLVARAQQPDSSSASARESKDDAWWTGPMLAASPNTLPAGHFYIEPYVFDVHTSSTDAMGSLTYVNYGVANNFTVGLIPTFGFNIVSQGTNSSGVGMGDLSLLAQYRLTQFRVGSQLPTIAVVAQESFPIGKYDRLGSRPSDGLGGGAYTTTLSVYSQTYFWMPNGRILRTRLDVSQAFSNSVHVEDVSVYGTSDGFRGRAQPGHSTFADLAGEYSVTQRWVLALDAFYRHGGNTQVTGTVPLGPGDGGAEPIIQMNSGTSDGFGVAPGIEYNWTPRFGVLLATRIIFAGHNTTSSLSPAIALSMFY